jgi:uncharacterized protein YgiM (DUF1202 family)
VSDDTTQLDDTARAGDTARLSDTARLTDTARLGDTARADDTVQETGTAAAMSGVVLATGQTIVLNGKDCTIENRIKSSGEADVYIIKIDGKPYIFKHYRPDKPLSDTAREVLSKIKNNPHDRIIKIIDFGKYNNQDYEIMEFAEGGTLDEDLKQRGAINDEKKLKNIVKMINEGLKQLHDKYNVIYQDLKPENILFRDEKQTKLVLADFGISSVMETGAKKAKVVASLTDLYGALELKGKTGHKEVVATPAVDYYSLGITMIEMWLGEKPFEKLTVVDRDYMISEESASLPPDMSDDCKTLIQGLLKYSPKDRWGNKQIQQWLDGIPLQQTEDKVILGYVTEMFNDGESYSNPKELADLMKKYPDQGEKLLYSGIAEAWFRKSGRELRAEEIKEVIAAYPQDKQSGYYTAIYKLDPGRAWISRGGKTCTNLEEIAQALTSESAYYMEELKNSNAQLYLYLTAVEGANGEEVSQHFRKYFSEYKPQHALSLVCLKLQDDSVTIGLKKYESPEEITQEEDSTQINLIKKAVMESDSLLLVWLSSFYQDKLPSASKFSEQAASGQFFLLGILPYLLYKDFDLDWHKSIGKILEEFINNYPGRADLFEAYAKQGFSFNDNLDAPNKTPLDFIVSNFRNMLNKHGEDTIINLIRLLVKLGADINGSKDIFLLAINEKNDPLINLLIELGVNVNASPDILLLAAKTRNVQLVKELLDMGADKEAVNIAYKYIATEGNIDSTEKKIINLLNPSGITKVLVVPKKVLNNIADRTYNMNKNASSAIFNIICTVGIALGSWTLLERVFGLGFWWSLGVSTVVVIVSILFTRNINFTEKYNTSRAVAILVAFNLAVAGTVCFFIISNPVNAKSSVPIETIIILSEVIVFYFYKKIGNGIDKIASVIDYNAPLSTIFSIICTAGIALGSWVLLENVFRLGLWWSIGASATIVICGFLFTKHIALKNGARPVKVLTVLTLAVVGTIYFFSITKPFTAENLIPIEMTMETSTVITATVTSDALNFRASPSGSGNLIKTLRKGDTLTVTGEPTESGWMPVEHSGDTGYVSAEYITVSAGEQIVPVASAITTTPGGERASSVATEPAAFNADDTVTGILTKIRLLRLLSIPFVTVVLTKINSLSLLSVPFAILGFIICFNIFRSRKYKYKSPIIKIPVFIICCLLIAFVSLKLLPVIRGATTAQKATVTVDALNMRSSPSTSGNIIMTLKKGDTLTVTGQTEKGWVPVKHRSNTGYVSAEYISIVRTGGQQVETTVSTQTTVAQSTPPAEQSVQTLVAPAVPAPSESSIPVFPFTGSWKLTGKDSANWTADLVIEEKTNEGFSGYFDWYRDGLAYSGREYYRGVYNSKDKLVVLEGYRLVNPSGIALGKYEAFLARNGLDFEAGNWGEGFIRGTWSAKWQNQ